jgi:hypothetical protein
MRAFVFCLVTAFALHAFAGEVRIGKITATSPTAQNNKTTATPFFVPSDTRLTVQCDAAVYIEVTDGAVCTAATSDSFKLAADAWLPTSTPPGHAHHLGGCVSILPVTGTANCKVATRSGNE